MHILFHRLVEVLAGSSESALRQQVQYLRAENQVLRSRLGNHIKVTPQERARLVKFGMRLGTALASVVTIVKPLTFMKWIREAKRVPKRKRATRKPGRPRTPDDIRRLILRIARETGWGFTRIQGELRKLGISTVSRSTIINILKQASMPTGPDRQASSWHEFMRRHAKTLWACDFITHRVLTPRGLKYAFSLVFVHPKTRRAFASGSTTNPDRQWYQGVVADFAGSVPDGMFRPRLVARDRDSKYGAGFDDALAERGIDAVRLPFRSPNMNAHVERLIQSVRTECLDHFVVVGTRHLDHLLAEYINYHNRQRPHSSLGFATPMGRRPEARAGPVVAGTIRCRERLGGVIKHYTRVAA